MSARAEQHYAEMAGSHQVDVTKIPDILNGTPVPLAPEDAELSLHSRQEAIVTEITANYSDVVLGIKPFLIACASEGQVQDTQPQDTPPTPKTDDLSPGLKAHLSSVQRHLIPEGRITGALKNVMIQAVDPSEISNGMVRKTTHLKGPLDKLAEQAAFLVTSASITRAGGRSAIGYTAFLSVVSFSPISNGLNVRARQFSETTARSYLSEWGLASS